ncbi:ribonuclease HII [Halomarina ordinaria]|uniref:Ribonuclease HII n=1 Tax=Halomarina ordinaria TaxID=3033939 RepID=A0ABD5UI39_9EURY|nr:ribonuclease HII [Halomarina sp. PSRA2]
MHFGVDEAGKGPVLGPMVAACVVAPTDALPGGVDDSKRLSPGRRESLDAALRDHPAVTVGVARIPVARIDDPGTDMNSLTVAAHAEAVRDAGLDRCRACPGVLDAGDVDAERFGRRVVSSLGGGVDLRAEHRADAAYPHVAAASVVAKVERDAAVARLAATHGEVGSGYPSDPTTRTFLREYVREHGTLPECARASWKTCEDVLAAAEQSSLDAF